MAYYRTLGQQCQPMTSARTSTWIGPNVMRPMYTREVDANDLCPASSCAPPSLFATSSVPASPAPKSSNATNPSCCNANGTRIDTSPDSRDPKNWGPHLWYYLHTSAMNYPIHPSHAQKEGMKALLCNLQYSIPCPSCSKHYGSYIQKHQPDLDQICGTRDSLFAFLVEIHNKVNRRQGKPDVTVAEARKMYPQFVA